MLHWQAMQINMVNDPMICWIDKKKNQIIINVKKNSWAVTLWY